LRTMSNFYRYFLLLLFMLCFISESKASAVFTFESNSSLKADSEYLEFFVKPYEKEAIFKLNAAIGYDITVNNQLKTAQKGTLSYIVTTPKGEKVTENSMPVDARPGSVNKYTFKIPGQKTGVYNVSFMINVSEYDDTARKVFCVNPQAIRSPHPKPADFDAFWDNTKKELSAIDPNFKITEHPEMESKDPQYKGMQVYLIEMQSLYDVPIRGWMTIARDRKPKEKFPVWLILPGYQRTLNPVFGPRDMVIITLNIRGHGNSKEVINVPRDYFLTTNIEDREKYVMRGAIMDCVRMVDYICSNPSLDSSKILCAGGSMGGYLAIALASLDHRILLCDANNPVFCDFRELPGKDWPRRDIELYAQENEYPLASIMKNLDYYDLKNFTNKLVAKSILAISLLDNLAPPQNEFAMLNNIPQKYRLFVYPDMAHEVPPSLFTFLSSWMLDEFGIF
jgi:cephalosporin-C deacetylase